MNFKKVLDFLKLSNKHAAILFFVSSLLLFLPEKILIRLSLLEFRNSFNVWIGIACIISISILICSFFKPILSWVKKIFRDWIIIRIKSKRLKILSGDEKELLKYYFDNDTRTQLISYSNGVAKELESHYIVRRVSNISSGISRMFPYNIQPWAWNYLNKHKELLED